MSEILNQFRDEELPASTVDISGAMRASRRQQTQRRLAAGGAVVAVVVAGATASLLLSPRPSSSPPPAAPAAPTCDAAEAPPQSPSPTWEYFDPLTMEIDASGVDGYRVTVSATSTYFQQVALEGDGGSALVMLYATGGEPHSITNETLAVDPAAGEPANPVNSAPAYWLAPSDPATLAWQWSPGAWAVVSPIPPELAEGASPPSQEELRAIATQVAPHLKFGAGTPVTAPFALPLPACLYPATTLQYHARDNGREVPVSFYLGFDTFGTAPPTHVAGYVPHLWVNANAFASVDDLPEGTTPYTDEDLGYPAYHSDQRKAEGRESDILLVFDVFGFGLEIEPRLMPATPEERLAFAADIFRTITIYPDAATELSAWGDPITP